MAAITQKGSQQSWADASQETQQHKGKGPPFNIWGGPHPPEQGVWEAAAEEWAPDPDPYPHDLENQFDMRDILWAAWEPTHQNEVVPLGALETLWRTHNSEAAFNALHPVVHEEIRRMLTEHITHATHPKEAEDADADIHPLRQAKSSVSRLTLLLHSPLDC